VSPFPGSGINTHVLILQEALQDTPCEIEIVSFFLNVRYAFILLTSTLVPGINYCVVTTHPLHQLQ